MSRVAMRGGLYLTSLALLLIELTLTRMFSVTLDNNFAFLVISIAIFGLSLAGVVVYLLPNRFLSGRLPEQATAFASLIPYSLLLLTTVALILPVNPSSSFRDVVLLSILYLTATVPFVLGGFVITLLLTHHAEDIGRLYFADLAGAASGALLTVPLLNLFGGPTTLLVAGALAGLAGITFCTQASRAELPTSRRLAAFCALLGLSLLLFGLFGEVAIQTLGRRMFSLNSVYSGLGKPFEYYYSLYRPDIHDSLTGIGTLGVLVLLGSAVIAWFVWRGSCGIRVLAVVSCAIAVGTVAINYSYEPLRVRYAKGHFQPPPLFERWNTYSRVAVFRPASQQEDIGWGLSPTYKGPLPDQLAVDIDAGASTPIIRFDGDPRNHALEHLAYDVTSLVFHIHGRSHTLVIGPGGGRDVLTALYFGSPAVTAVELNPIIADVVNDRFAHFSGRLYQNRNVSLVIDEGRSFVRRTTEQYGVIQLSLVDTWASTAAGAHALSENSLYTVEAFRDYLAHLEPNGILSVSRWLFNPMRETLRAVAIARASLPKLKDYSRHIVVVASPTRAGTQIATILVKREPFTDAEIEHLSQVVERLQFVPLALPGRAQPNPIRDFLESDSSLAFYAKYPYDVRPSSDDWPFFFNTMKPSQYVSFWTEPLPGQAASRLTAWLFVVVLAFVVSLIVAPVVAMRGREVGQGSVGYKAVFFAAIGLGFILVEIALIELLSLYLGHPIYSLVVVIVSLLVCAAFGAGLTERLKAAEIRPIGRGLIGTLILLLFAYSLWVPNLIRPTIGRPLAFRVGLVLILVGPIALLMGTALPLGIRHVQRHSLPLVPWMWAINGAFSVLGSVVAVILSMNLGIRATLTAGAVAYLIALATIPTGNQSRTGSHDVSDPVATTG